MLWREGGGLDLNVHWMLSINKINFQMDPNYCN